MEDDPHPAGPGTGGDWCEGPRVECAVLSEWALADRELAARAGGSLVMEGECSWSQRCERFS